MTTAEEDLVPSDVLAAASRVLARDGLESFNLSAVARELEASTELLRRLFPDEKALLRALVIGSLRNAGEHATAALEGAETGSDALTAFVRAYAEHYLDRLDEFRQVYMLRQLAGHERFGLGPRELEELEVPVVNRPIDVLEAKIVADRKGQELQRAVHPRRLAFSAQVTAVGLVTVRGLAHAAGVSLKHGHDVLVQETSRAFGAALSALRHLTVINEVAVELTRLRSEAQLRASIAGYLMRILDLEAAGFLRRGEERLDSGNAPESARLALSSGRTVHARVESGDAPETVATPVRYEGEPEGVLWGVTAPGRPLDERDVARLETFATMIGLSLENVRLYEDLQAQLDARTEKLREAHVRLAESGKMAALGKLVAGVVHELNTPVASVISSEQTLSKAAAKLRASLPADVTGGRAFEILEQSAANIGTGARRVSSIVQQLKRFSRLDAAEIETVDLNAAISDALALLKGELEPGCTVEADLGELALVTCFAGRLNHVLMNVIRNAAQAVGERGTVRVRTRMSPPDRVVIVVEDDGVGIEPDQLAHIFEPGFIAKGGVVRAGMGLATSYQVVRDHGGDIRIESEPGRGTRVTIELPLRCVKNP